MYGDLRKILVLLAQPSPPACAMGEEELASFAGPELFTHDLWPERTLFMQCSTKLGQNGFAIYGSRPQYQGNRIKIFRCFNSEFLRKSGIVEYEIEFFTGTSSMHSNTALIKIGTRADLPVPGKVKEFLARGRFICIANVDGEICAMDNVCPHWGGPLGQGTIENGKIVCPWHGWQYDPRTGETPRKADVRLTIFKLQLEGDDVFVEL